MTTDDPIAEARALLAELDGEWRYTKGRDNWDIHSEKKRGSAWIAEVFDERDAALIAAAPRLLQALIERVPPEWVVVLGLCASCDHPFDDHEEDGECWADDGCEGCGEYEPSRRYPPKPTREPAE